MLPITPALLATLSRYPRWPRTAAEIVRVIGRDASVPLFEKFRGQEIPVPMVIGGGNLFGAFAPVVTTGWDTVLMEAKKAKIPVVLTDRSIETKDPSLYVTMIGSDFTEEGRKAAKWLLENYKGQGDVNIVELQGTVGSAPAIERKKGFEEVIKSEPRFKITRSQTGDFTRAKGKEVMEAFLKTDKNIQVLFAHNDDMAIGAIQAIEAAGIKPGKDIIIVSIDAVKGAFEAMMAGKLNVSVECNPLLGPQLMNIVKDVKAGKELPKRINTEESIFPMETAAKEFPNRKY